MKKGEVHLGFDNQGVVGCRSWVDWNPILGMAIGKSNRARFGNSIVSIRGFSSMEVSLGAVISNSITKVYGSGVSFSLSIRSRLVSRSL